jgi:hypothetical protein
VRIAGIQREAEGVAGVSGVNHQFARAQGRDGLVEQALLWRNRVNGDAARHAYPNGR